ncbi:MAG: MarR family winged helix-turn-helix transcriptional regulator [Actinomycetales bacterium]
MNSVARGSARSGRLTHAQIASWRSFLRAHAAVTRKLEADLLAEHKMPLAWYDVMVQLVEAPDHRLRMTDLAGAVLISRSGLTRLVDRLVAEGLVRREPAPHDARGTFAVLTDTGYERLRAATPTHLRGVGGYVIDRVSPDQLRALGEACNLIAAPDVDRPAAPAGS